MKREPLVYAALLVAALAVAFRTWTHEERIDVAEDSVELWHGRAEDILAVEYTESGFRLQMERRGPAQAPYLWTIEDTAAFRMDAGTSKNLLSAVAAPRANRDLGAPDARARRAFGLDTSRTRLVVRFRDGTRELLLGGQTVLRSGDRYVLERRTGHVFILPALSLPPLANAAQMLVEHRLHAFAPDTVAGVTLRAAGRTMVMRRLPGTMTAGAGMGPDQWAPVTSPERPDSAFTAFMLRANGAAAATYAAREDPRTMTAVLRLEYTDRGGRLLGFLELLQRPGAAGTPEFFARSELTEVLVRLYPGTAEALAADAARPL